MKQQNIFFINEHWIVHFILGPLIHCIEQNVRIKSIGNCVSRISKNHLLDLEEFIKNATSSEKGRVKTGLDRLTGGT